MNANLPIQADRFSPAERERIYQTAVAQLQRDRDLRLLAALRLVFGGY